MRKYAGFFIATMLMLVPALANAFTLMVKVNGGSASLGNTVGVTRGATKTITGGTNYLYPADATTLTINKPAGYTATYKYKNGAAAPVTNIIAATTYSPTILTECTLASSLEVTYTAPALVGLSIDQATGGTIIVQLPNNTTNTDGGTNLVAGTNLPITIQAIDGYTIDTVTVDGGVTPGPTVAGATRVSFDYTAVAAGTLTATFTKTANDSIYYQKKLSATLLAPLAGFKGQLVKSSAIANGATGFAFRVYSTPTTRTAAAAVTNASYFEFTPDAIGTYMVQVVVTSADATDTKYAKINVTSLVNYQVSQCTSCHSSSTPKVVSDFNSTSGHMNSQKLGDEARLCTTCHTAAPHNNSASCIGCHSVAQNQTANGTFVNDNNGVRAITGEFAKWSHHVTGVELQDAHCAACHLEGKSNATATEAGTKIVVDPAYHMVNAKTHLRNVDNDGEEYEWDPASPNFTNMDNFCMGCHDANGATSAQSILIRKLMAPAAGKIASATNPFGDTISNQYDKEERPAVVDAAGQFATGNNSHHAVLGKKYTGRTRIAGSRAIAGAALAQTDVAAFNNHSSAAMPGIRSTIYDANKFEGSYTTLEDASGENDGLAADLLGRNGGNTLGDDSTLHCADCHTVGQYRASDMTGGTTAKPFNNAVIGAHGSNNEYMLRNNIGTDEKHIGRQTNATGKAGFDFTHTKPYLVCFNCHLDTVYDNDGAGPAHAGERTATPSACNMPQNTNTVNKSGEGRLGSYLNVPGYVGLPATEGAIGDASKGVVTFGNVFGIQCNNCHNSGVNGNLFGGIHGSKVQTYTDGMGNLSKHNRFMPGLGNTMYVPGTKGGFTGGSQVLYKNYSGYSFARYSAVSGTDRRIKGIKPAAFAVAKTNNVPYTTDAVKQAPSYTFTSGGVSNDLNWEQKVAQSVAGQTDPVAAAMGCYTLSPTGTNKVNFEQSKGYPADDQRKAATDSQTTNVDGRELFDNWGGCDDHNGAQGKGTAPTRNVLRRTSY